jgi:Fe-S oxidoreductase
VLVASLMRDVRPGDGTRAPVTFHDPCYLGRYAGRVDEPRELLTRFGGDIKEPVRNRDNPFCCGAGGGLLFADKEEEPGSRISDVRLKQLQDTGAPTVVTACPFCSIMLKGAQASADKSSADKAGATPGAGSAPAVRPMAMTDLMSYVADRLPGVRPAASSAAPSAAAPGPAAPGEPAS